MVCADLLEARLDGYVSELTASPDLDLARDHLAVSSQLDRVAEVDLHGSPHGLDCCHDRRREHDLFLPSEHDVLLQ